LFFRRCSFLLLQPAYSDFRYRAIFLGCLPHQGDISYARYAAHLH